MSRQQKKGVDYFPFDVDFFADRKIKELRGKYGADGVTLYLYLLCQIYKDEGYYLAIDDGFDYVLSADLGMDSNKTGQILNFLCKRGLFDAELFTSDKVLTSHGIQMRYQEIVKFRGQKTEIAVNQKYWLLKKEEIKGYIKVTHFSNTSEKKADFSEKKADFSMEKRHKVKESKGKESKVNKNIYTAKPSTAYAESISKITDKWNTLEIYDIPKVIKMTSEMPRYKRLKKLLDDYGLDKIIEAIDYIPQSDFLLGRTDGNWRIDFDFFVRPDKFLKILEGGYSGKKVKKPSAGSRWDALAEEYNKREDDIIDV